MKQNQIPLTYFSQLFFASDNRIIEGNVQGGLILALYVSSNLKIGDPQKGCI